MPLSPFPPEDTCGVVQHAPQWSRQGDASSITPHYKTMAPHNVRMWSQEFVEARIQRLLTDTYYHHAEICVHHVAASPSVRPGSQGRDLEMSQSRPNWRPKKPYFLGFLLLACLIKARVPWVSSGLPVQPPSVQPPEARSSIIYCATPGRLELQIADIVPIGWCAMGQCVCTPPGQKTS